jgi:hypothetical protein
MTLKFNYSLDYEILRVEETINKCDLFKKFNYKLFFPKGYSLDSKDLSKLKYQISKEMNISRVKKIEKEINLRWKKDKKFIDLLLKSITFKKPATLLIKFTQYGVGGSYWLPNKVIININYTRLDYYETLFHELIHLMIEKPVIEKYSISHESKEALIDYIITRNKYLHKMFPDYKVQKMFINQLPSKNILDKINWI